MVVRSKVLGFAIATSVILATFAAVANETAGEGAGLRPTASTANVSVAVTPVATPADASATACARKVKIVYAGYGEAQRAGCNVASTVTTGR